jgi:hypothetical protein
MFINYKAEIGKQHMPNTTLQRAKFNLRTFKSLYIPTKPSKSILSCVSILNNHVFSCLRLNLTLR